MAKSRSKYVCQSCGHEAHSWMGKCPSCSSWDSIKEESIQSERSQNRALTANSGKTYKLSAKESCKEEDRILTHLPELDKLLGGGIMRGAAMLIGGEPGVGKSTLSLQIMFQVAQQDKTVLYVSGEESLRQIRLRASRLGSISENIEVLCETNLDVVKSTIKKITPAFVIIDSIQMLFKEELTAAPGTVSQVRECSSDLVFLGKSLDIPILFIGHLTKSGEIAGPRVLEHLVDTVLYFEGERLNTYRILRAFKNRFGSTNEIAVYEMMTDGLKEVSDPSRLFMTKEREAKPGCIVVPCIEGTRPLLIELQALTISATFGAPLRKTSGIDSNRLSVILAILEKHVGLSLRGEDVFVNAAGGLNVKEPALDVGIALAIASSFLNKSIPANLVAFGEIGLDGDLRAVSHTEKRLKESRNMGFTNIIEPEKFKTVNDVIDIICK